MEQASQVYGMDLPSADISTSALIRTEMPQAKRLFTQIVAQIEAMLAGFKMNFGKSGLGFQSDMRRPLEN